MSLRFVIGAAIAAALLTGVDARAQLTHVPLPLIVAQTNQPSRQQGNVAAGGVTWACENRTCSTRGPLTPTPLESCRALVAQVGAVTSFGRPGAMLNATDLAACNPRVLTQVRPNIPITPQGVPGLVLRTPPVTVDVPELSIVGGPMREADSASAAVTVNVPELSLVGGAVRPADGDSAAVIVNVEELSLVGR